MPAGFTAGSRTLQDEFGTRALADRIDTLLVHDTIDEGDRAFIEARDMFVLAGRPCRWPGRAICGAGRPVVVRLRVGVGRLGGLVPGPVRRLGALLRLLEDGAGLRGRVVAADRQLLREEDGPLVDVVLVRALAHPSTLPATSGCRWGVVG